MQGKLVIVTGGSKGIGFAISSAFAEAGAHVAMIARTPDALDAAIDTIRASGGAATGFRADVRESSETQRVYGQIRKALGVPAVLVNNAGIHTGFGPFWEIDEVEWNADLSVNLTGTYNVSRAVAPDLIRQGNGRIINLVGGGFDRATRYMSAYAVSKTAIMRLTEIMALELAEYGLTVFALAPGLVDTPGNRAKVARDAVRRWSSLPEILKTKSIAPEHAARLALELASGRFDALTGRAFFATEDLDRIEVEQVLSSDSRRLSMRR